MKKLNYVLCFLIVFLSCDDIIEVEDISDKTVHILAPTNASVLSIETITFSWETIEEAEIYYIQVATPTFENATQILVDSSLTKTSLIKTLPANSYEWRVRAEN